MFTVIFFIFLASIDLFDIRFCITDDEKFFCRKHFEPGLTNCNNYNVL